MSKTKMPIITYIIYHCTRNTAVPIREEKEIEGIKMGNEKTKLSFFADYRMVYLKNPRESTKKISGNN